MSKQNKSLLKSKTVWFSVIILCLSYIQDNIELLNDLLKDNLQPTLFVIGFLSLVLRLITSEQIKFSDFVKKSK